jgi:hypothetical protein
MHLVRTKFIEPNNEVCIISDHHQGYSRQLFSILCLFPFKWLCVQNYHRQALKPLLRQKVALQPNLVRKDFESLMRAKLVRSKALCRQYLLDTCEKFCHAFGYSLSYYTIGWLISVSLSSF